MAPKSGRSELALNRRRFLRLGAAASALAACSRVPATTRIVIEPATAVPATATIPGAPALGLAPSATAAPTLSAASGALTESALAQAWLAANRIMFGPRAGDLERIARMGLDAFVDEQLAAAAEPEDAEVQRRLAPLDTLSKTPGQILEKYSGDPRGPGIRRDILLDLQQAAVIRAVYSRRQLFEVMVDFWNNHFNVGFNKKFDYLLKPDDDRSSIRPHAMGTFRALLGASAKSPAVLQSLDNDSNVRGKINENYGRELLELHTVGADNGYTQQDVLDAARAFTGWSINTLREDAGKAGTFMYRPRAHDEDAKTVMGLRIPANGGMKDGEALLDFLAVHPNTARTLSLKLCRRFIADAPAESVVSAGAAAFTASKGDIKATLSAILRSPEFKASFGQKIKRPLEYVASALRAMDADTTAEPRMQQALAAMGQPLFLWQPPNGFPDTAGAYLGASSFLARWNFALDLANAAYKETRVKLDALAGKGDLIDGLAQRLFGGPLPASIKITLQPFASGRQTPQLVALMLCAPLFQVRG
ncbi:MAG: DUF1800 domain-containing protein [Anaerolineae bacterium]|nr:DUF1800 domain-containing protein [Anaerolineae bacterium]